MVNLIIIYHMKRTKENVTHLVDVEKWILLDILHFSLYGLSCIICLAFDNLSWFHRKLLNMPQINLHKCWINFEFMFLKKCLSWRTHYFNYRSKSVLSKEALEDTKGAIRICISKKNRQHFSQKKSTKGQTMIYKTYI